MALNPRWILQAATIPVQGRRVCLVTSTSGKRWVIPKGIIEAGKTAGETALQEAWEEAGLTGVMSPEPVGSYCYDKYGGTCYVTVFVLEVTEEADDWPERGMRDRAWMGPSRALTLIDEAGLAELIRAATGRPKPKPRGK